MTDTAYTPALPVAELLPGQMRCVDVTGVAILLVHARDGIFAVQHICTHAFARLDEGRLRGNRLICPLHGASFDVRDGAVLGAPATAPLRSFPVRVADGQIAIQV